MEIPAPADALLRLLAALLLGGLIGAERERSAAAEGERQFAAGGVSIAMLANTLSKGVYAAWFGSPPYRGPTVVMLGVVLAAGTVGLFIWDLVP